MSRYQTDPQFRESVKSSNRRSARKHYGLNQGYSDVNLMRRKIVRERFGVARQYMNSEKRPVLGLTFTVKEMASLIGKCEKTLDLWIATERFPKPTLITFVKWKGLHRALYSDEQACQLIDILNEHFQEKFTLSVDDIATRTKLLTTVYGPNSVITHAVEGLPALAA